MIAKNRHQRHILWVVFGLQILVLLLALWLVAVPLAKRSASDLAGLMLMSAKTWHNLPEDHRADFIAEIQQDTNLSLERGVLPSLPEGWKPHWYADWVKASLVAQGMIPIQVNMQKETVEVLLLIEGEPLVLRTASPSLGRIFALFLCVSLLAMIGTLLALWWQKRWQLQMWRHQLVLSGLAHDFRTPLTRLKLQLALLSPIASEQAAQMNRQIGELADMIDMTLTLATQKNTQVQEKPFSVLWQGWQLAYPEVSFQVTPEDEALLLLSVSGLLGRIVQNLVDNALAHGQGKVRVTLSHESKGWTLSVQDDGDGIPDVVWRSIEQDCPPPAKGLGLGLLSSRWLAELAGLKLRRIHKGVLILQSNICCVKPVTDV